MAILIKKILFSTTYLVLGDIYTNSSYISNPLKLMNEKRHNYLIKDL